MAKFVANDRVNRLEDRATIGATVIEVVLDGDGASYYLIAYDEGGEGWWPESALEAAA